MKKFLVKIMLIIPLILVIGVGCKGPSQDELAAVRPVTINYWTIFNDVSMLREFANEYQQLRPYVKVNIRQVRIEEFDNLFTNALADDVGPDIISVHSKEIKRYLPRLTPMPATVKTASVSVKGQYAQEQVITLEEHSMPTSRAIESNFVSTVANDVVVGNNVYGLPLAMDTLAIYYNKDLLDRAGIATPPKTWEEFLDAVQKTTTFGADGRIIQSGVPLGTGNNIDNAADILALFMLQKDVPVIQGRSAIFSDDVRRLKNNHPSFEALRFYTDFANPLKEVYSWNASKENSLTAFSRGQSVFYVGYAFDRRRILAQAPQMNLEVIPIPQLQPQNPQNIANYWVESVVKKSKNSNMAWDFMRYITSQNNIKRYVEATNQPSPVRAHLSAQIEDPAVAPFASQVLTAKNWYNGRNMSIANKALEDLIENYVIDVPEGEDVITRDINLLEQAALKIQQTL